MNANVDMRAYNQGRPKLTPLERARRKARREQYRYDEMRSELNEKGWESTETRRGRPKATRQYKVFKQLMKLRRAIHAMRRLEREQGAERVAIESIRDPLLEHGTVHKVGRKPANELAKLDLRLNQAMDWAEDIVRKIYDAGSIEPQSRYHRHPLERLEFHERKIKLFITQIQVMETTLSREDAIHRQIKLLYGDARENRKKAKENSDNSMGKYYAMGEKHAYSRVDTLKHFLADAEMKTEEQGYLIEPPEISISHYYEARLNSVLSDIERIRRMAARGEI